MHAAVVFVVLAASSGCATVGSIDQRRDAAPVVSADSTRPDTYFFDDLEYGSQSTFGPASVFLNRGFDVFQFAGISRHLAAFPFRRGARDVARSVARPREQIERIGLGRFLTTEILPLNFTTSDARWYPNYTLHLVGGGITYTTLREWFSSRNVGAPGAWSALVIISSGFMNEITENRGVYGKVADHVADLYVFDIAGIMLFSVDGVNRFFSHSLHAADWSPVPSVTTAGNLQNAGQYTVLRIGLPGTDRFRLFFRMGLGGMLGVSVRTSPSDSFTLAGGTATDELVVLDADRGEIGIRSRAAVGLFYDRNNSLLASLVVKPSVKEPAVLNIYPGVLPLVGRHAGIWVALHHDMNPTVGISLRHTFGLGFGAGR